MSSVSTSGRAALLLVEGRINDLCAPSRGVIMNIAPAATDALAGAEKEFTRGGSRRWQATAIFLLLVPFFSTHLPDIARSQELSGTQAPIEGRIQSLIPRLETYIQDGMKAFDVPGVAVGIVANDRL